MGETPVLGEPGAVRGAYGGTAPGTEVLGPGGTAPGPEALGPSDLGSSWLAESWRTYRMVAGMWIRSTMTYRASFALTLVTSFAVTFFDFVVILLMFGQVEGLGGFAFAEVAFLYGATGTSFGLADLTMGSLQRMGKRVRDGSFDMFLLRPAPVLAQVAADKFALRRLGRVAQGLFVLIWALLILDLEWTAVKVLLLPVMLLCGTLIFSAVMIVGASALFWAQDAAEVTSSFTYGGNTLLQYPPAIFAQDLVRGSCTSSRWRS